MICPMTSPGFLPVLPVPSAARRTDAPRLAAGPPPTPTSTAAPRRHVSCPAPCPPVWSRRAVVSIPGVPTFATGCQDGTARSSEPASRGNPGRIRRPDCASTAARPRRPAACFRRSRSSAVSAFVSRALPNRFPAPALQDFGHAPAGVAGQCAGGVARLPEPSGRRSSPPTRILRRSAVLRQVLELRDGHRVRQVLTRLADFRSEVDEIGAGKESPGRGPSAGPSAPFPRPPAR